MRRGRFERHWDPDGGFVFRLRWDAEPRPTPEERRRLEFLRYLVKSGRLSEEAEE